MTIDRYDAVIVGSGPNGLAAAVRLAEDATGRRGARHVRMARRRPSAGWASAPDVPAVKQP